MRPLGHRSLALLVAATLSVVPSARAQSPGSSTPPAAQLSDEAELARAVTLYDAGKYAECEQAIGALLSPTGARRLSEPKIVERARTYHAACLIGSGQADRADQPLRDALHANPQMKPPDNVVFPQAVTDKFIQVRDSMRSELDAAEAARLEKLEEERKARLAQQQADLERIGELKLLAGTETVITRNHRAVALLPFGVGQFQNGDWALGWVFLTTEGILAGAAMTSLVVRAHLNEAGKEPNANTVEVNDRLQDWHTALKISGYGFLAVAAGGIVHAQLAFEPEFRSTRPRPLPPRLQSVGQSGGLRIRPSIAPVRGGVGFGFSGVF
jgi:hypothetical protein